MSAVGKPQGTRRSWRNIWINPDYQSRYVFWISVTGLILVVINAAIFYFYVSQNYSILVDLSPMTDDAKAQLYRELRQIIGLLFAANLVFLGLVSFIGLMFSHRTAGPLYKFKKTFLQIRDGDTALRLHLRPKDDFRDVAHAFNEMMDVLQGKKKQ